MNTVLRRTDLSASCVWPSDHSALNHRCALAVALSRNPLALQASYGAGAENVFPVLDNHRSGLRLWLAGSPNAPAESGSLSCGLVVHLPLLSTLPQGNAVTFGYRPECACLKRTCTFPTKHTYRRT